MATKRPVLCEGCGAQIWKNGYCSSCGGYFLDNRFFLSPKEQKERYLLHDNSLENQGYRQFLKKFFQCKNKR